MCTMLLLLLLHLCSSLSPGDVTAQDQPPPSPCPDVFSYVYDGGQWSASLAVPVPDMAKRMVVVASLFVVDIPLPPEHPGELQLVHDEKTVKQQVQSHKTKIVHYNLELPTQSPLPLVDKLKVNSRVICQGPPVNARIRSRVTFTHRLNGLLLSPSRRPAKLPDLQPQGDSLDTVNDDKQPPKKGLELTDDEVIKVQVQEEEFASNQEDMDQQLASEVTINSEDTGHVRDIEFNPDDDAELLDTDKPDAENYRIHNGKNIGKKRPSYPGTELHPNLDVELLDNEIPNNIEAFANKDSHFNRLPFSNKGPKDFPKTEFYPNEDAEFLDNMIPDSIPNHKGKYHNTNRRPISKKGPKDFPKTEFYPDEDAELLDNEMSALNSPEAQHTPKHKIQNSNGGDLPSNDFHPDDDKELLDNDAIQAESPEVYYIPGHKSQQSGSVGKNTQNDLTIKGEFDRGESFELFDNEIVQEADIHKVQNTANLKKHASNFNVGYIGKKGKMHHPKSEFDLDESSENMLGNEILQEADIHGVHNLATNPKYHVPNINRGFYTAAHEADLSESVYQNDDDTMNSKSGFKYNREFNDPEYQSNSDDSVDVLDF